MRSRPFSLAAAAVLDLVAFGHILRAALGLDLVIGSFRVPIWGSVVAAIVACGLAVGLFFEVRR